MLINKEIEKAINDQINAELYSAYLYLSMAAYFESENLKGFANWMQVQAKEEVEHAMKFYSYLNERGGRVFLSEIKKPETEWDSPLAIFEHVYEHEKGVTERIYKLVDLATSKNDHATKSLLNWFVDEQVEEEASANEILEMLKRVKDSPNALFMLDSRLGGRK